MRYVVRWHMGYWRVLDLNEYVEVGMFGLQKLAEQAAEDANLEEFAAPARQAIKRAKY